MVKGKSYMPFLLMKFRFVVQYRLWQAPWSAKRMVNEQSNKGFIGTRWPKTRRMESKVVYAETIQLRRGVECQDKQLLSVDWGYTRQEMIEVNLVFS